MWNLNRSKANGFALLVAVAALVGNSEVALAESDVIEEVIVTATKRSIVSSLLLSVSSGGFSTSPFSVLTGL